jgi:hypothetical protein
VAAAVLVVPVVAVLVYAIIRNGGLEHFLANFERGARAVFQLYVPLCLTVAVQWALTRRTLPRPAEAMAGATSA